MAVVNTKSAAISARDTPGIALVGPHQVKSQLNAAIGKVEVASGDSIASTFRHCQVPSSARVQQVLLRCTAITTCAGDIGLYRTAADGGAVVDADLFASAQSLASALTSLTDVTNESTTITPTLAEKRLWEVLGLTADPMVTYDVVTTLTAAAGSAGQVTVAVTYVE